MKYLICGSRDFDNYEFFERKMEVLNVPSEVISGGATGADSLAEEWATEYPYETKFIKVLPEWDLFGKSAGYIRNIKMLDMCPDLVIAFWDGVSRGTAHTIKEAKKRRISTIIFYY